MDPWSGPPTRPRPPQARSFQERGRVGRGWAENNTLCFTASFDEIEIDGGRRYRMSRDELEAVEYTGSGENGRVWLVAKDGSRSRQWFRPKDLGSFLERLRMFGWPVRERPKRAHWWQRISG